MKKNIIASSVLIIVSIVSFYLGTTVNSLVGAEKSMGGWLEGAQISDGFSAVVWNGKIYAVYPLKLRSGQLQFVYNEASDRGKID
jgi:hypothetical protein